MPEMKNSGIEWIGEIPVSWNVIKNKHFIQPIYSGGTPTSGNGAFYSDSGTPFVTIADMSTVDIVHATKNGVTQLGIADKKLKVIPKGTLIYSIYATVGEVAELGIDATINQALLALTPNEDIFNKNYYKYNLKAMKDYIFFSANKNTQYNLNAEKVRNFVFVLPPLDIQKSIADFLDQKCSEINVLSADIQSQIEALEEYKKSVITEAVTKGLNPDAEMKDSGIEWIGVVPKHWSCCKQKYLISLINGRAYKDVEFEDDGKYAVLRVGNLFTNPTWYYSNLELPADKYCKTGDLLYSWSMSYAPVIWQGDKVIYHYHIWKTVLNEKLNKDFAFYYLTALTEAIKAEIHETTMGFITMGTMNNSYIAYPDLLEQIQISQYLNVKCAEIDAVIADKKTQLETLAEYKKSLIYEYVTGKKEVPENEF